MQKRSPIAARYQHTRARTVELCRPLEVDDHLVQSAEFVSPPKWHLAHTTWFFEAFVLEPFLRQYQPHHPKYAFLFNSYYKRLGPHQPRTERGFLSRPTLLQVQHYRQAVDTAVLEALDNETLDPKAQERIELGIRHEEQHQELLLMDIKHILFTNPLQPSYLPPGTQGPLVPAVSVPPLEFVPWEGDLEKFGSDEAVFDNETPSFDAHVGPFALGNRLVTNAEFAEFTAAGGYSNPALWLSDGWDVLNREHWSAPLYWKKVDENWMEFTFHGMSPLEGARPVCHLSYYEADAYARWTGFRLPRELEWERAARGSSLDFGDFYRREHLSPAPYSKDGPISQLFGGGLGVD